MGGNQLFCQTSQENTYTRNNRITYFPPTSFTSISPRLLALLRPRYALQTFVHNTITSMKILHAVAVLLQNTAAIFDVFLH